MLFALPHICVAKPRRGIWPGVPGSDGVRKSGDRRRAWWCARSDRRWKNRLLGATRRRSATGHGHGNAAGRRCPARGNGPARKAAGGERISFQRIFEVFSEDPARAMRVLSVTQSYAPFYEFGGPPVKVEALANGLAQRGHSVTVLSADWGFEHRRISDASSRRSPFGWMQEVKGVQSIYLPTWFRYRALSWNPAVGRYCRARLKQFDAVHIFGLYDLLGPSVARGCQKQRIPYLVEPIGMFVPIVRNIALKRAYHALWGRGMLSAAEAVVATSEQEADELAGGGISREKIVLRRNGLMIPRELPARGTFRTKHGLPADAF